MRFTLKRILFAVILPLLLFACNNAPRYIESLHTELITCRFDGDKISIDTRYSFIPSVDFPDLTGQVAR